MSPIDKKELKVTKLKSKEMFTYSVNMQNQKEIL